MSFGRWVRKRRRAADLTQQELATKLEVTQGYISSIEKDENRNFGKDLVERFANALGATYLEAFTAWIESNLPPGHKMVVVTLPDSQDIPVVVPEGMTPEQERAFTVSVISSYRSVRGLQGMTS